jgi:hypothetical protein
MPRAKFDPTEEQRRDVELLAAVGTSQDAIAAQIVSPITGRAIKRTTLQRLFPNELENGRTKIQREILAAFRKRVNEQDWKAVEFGLRTFCNLRIDGTGVNVNIGTNGQPDAQASGIRVEFVTPQGREEFDENAPRPINREEMRQEATGSYPKLLQHEPAPPIGEPTPPDKPFVPLTNKEWRETYGQRPERLNSKQKRDALADRHRVEWGEFATGANPNTPAPGNPNRVWRGGRRGGYV